MPMPLSQCLHCTVGPVTSHPRAFCWQFATHKTVLKLIQLPLLRRLLLLCTSNFVLEVLLSIVALQ